MTDQPTRMQSKYPIPLEIAVDVREGYEGVYHLMLGGPHPPTPASSLCGVEELWGSLWPTVNHWGWLQPPEGFGRNVYCSACEKTRLALNGPLPKVS